MLFSVLDKANGLEFVIAHYTCYKEIDTTQI